MAREVVERDDRLWSCTQSYFSAKEDISGRLFEFLKENRNHVQLG